MKSPYVGMCVWPVPENKENYSPFIYPYMSSTLSLTKYMENVTITGSVNFYFPDYMVVSLVKNCLLRLLLTIRHKSTLILVTLLLFLYCMF
jgi:hypothetical protein